MLTVKTVMNRLGIIALLLSMSVSAQNYGVGAGTIIPKDKQMNVGYYIEADFIIKTNQERKYLNNLLLGFSHGGYMSGNISKIGEKEIKTEENCNCTQTDIEFGQSKYTEKKLVRAIGITFGVETFKRLYITTGITSSKHILKVNNEEINNFYTTHIDAGAKYFWKIKKSFLTTTFKFNPETVSFGLGYSR